MQGELKMKLNRKIIAAMLAILLVTGKENAKPG